MGLDASFDACAFIFLASTTVHGGDHFGAQVTQLLMGGIFGGVFLGADRTQPPAELFGTWYPGKEISAT